MTCLFSDIYKNTRSVCIETLTGELTGERGRKERRGNARKKEGKVGGGRGWRVEGNKEVSAGLKESFGQTLT